MILPLLLLAAASPQEPEDPLPVDQQEPGDAQEVQLATFDHLETFLDGDRVVMHLFGLEVEEPGHRLAADLAILSFDREEWEAARAEEEIRPGRRPRRPEDPANLLGGAWSRQILQWAPGGEELLLELFLDGQVEVRSPEVSLNCDRFVHHVRDGDTEVFNVDFELSYGQGPRGWPFRIRAGRLEERADGSLYATQVAVTTCNHHPPHYELTLDSLEGQPIENDEWSWAPEGGWLHISGIRLLPMPTPDFETGESMFGLRGLSIQSNKALGTAVRPEFGGQGELFGSVDLDWALFPTLSSRRGLPLDARFTMRSGIWRGDWQMFYLSDSATDVHRLANRVRRDGDQRFRLRLDNRFELDEDWRLDVDLAVSSDPLVDPEFFHEDWLHQDDALSEVYLRRHGDGSFLDVRAHGRLDEAGYTPLEGYPVGGSAHPQQLDALPRVRYDWFSTTVAPLPISWLAGDDELVPVNFSWGAEVARLAMRDTDLTLAPRTAPYVSRPDLQRDRARVDAELAMPLHIGPLFVRPGARFDGFAYDEDLLGGSGADRALVEGFVEVGALFLKDWEHGWQHRVLPQIRFRDRSVSGDPLAMIPQFDEFDAMQGGQAVEFSLRQFFYAPDATAPWFDFDILVPYYPDPADALDDGLFPAIHSFETQDHWGPAEFRMTWTPGTYGDTLKGIRLDSRLRQNFHEGEQVEMFGRLTIRPHERLEYGVSLQKVEDLFSQAQAFIDWRLSDEWGLRLVQPHNFTGAASKRSQLALRHYTHDLMLEVGIERAESQGHTGFFFNLQPRFLVEDAPPPDPARRP